MFGLVSVGWVFCSWFQLCSLDLRKRDGCGLPGREFFCQLVGAERSKGGLGEKAERGLRRAEGIMFTSRGGSPGSWRYGRKRGSSQSGNALLGDTGMKGLSEFTGNGAEVGRRHSY